MPIRGGDGGDTAGTREEQLPPMLTLTPQPRALSLYSVSCQGWIERRHCCLDVAPSWNRAARRWNRAAAGRIRLAPPGFIHLRRLEPPVAGIAPPPLGLACPPARLQRGSLKSSNQHVICWQ